MATIVKDLGAATAYGYAVEKGYTGTEEEFAELMASYASVAESAADSADAAAQSATNASNSAMAAATSASSASTAATTASTKAGEAETSAAAADGSASAAAQSATSASGSATSASESASAAAQSATSASGSATSASGSATAAAGSAAAAAASEAAAREVEESIPADYTALSEDVSELKSQMSGITTATATDEGKALKAKTVSGGKVTEWEFGETATIDDTLSIAGEAADAKAAGDAIRDIAGTVEPLASAVYAEIPIVRKVAYTSGKKINDSGATATDANYNIYFYPVLEGDLIVVNSDGNWQFQNSPLTGASYRIGSTMPSSAHDAKVPTGVYWVSVSILTTNNAVCVHRKQATNEERVATATLEILANITDHSYTSLSLDGTIAEATLPNQTVTEVLIPEGYTNIRFKAQSRIESEGVFALFNAESFADCKPATLVKSGYYLASGANDEANLINIDAQCKMICIMRRDTIKDISVLSMGNVNKSMLSFTGPYDKLKIYKKRNFCFYDDILYRRIADANGAETWDETKWRAIDFADMISETADFTLYSDFIRGTLNSNTGAIITRDYTIVTKDIIDIDRDLVLTLASGTNATIWYYNSDDTLLTIVDPGYGNSFYYVVKGSRIRVTLNITGSSVYIPDVEINNIAHRLTFQTAYGDMMDDISNGEQGYYTAEQAVMYQKGAAPKDFTLAPCILVAGQSNIDGRVPKAQWPSSIPTPFANIKNSINSTSGTFAQSMALPTSFGIDFSMYAALNDLNTPIYVIKKSLGATSISEYGSSNCWTPFYERLDSLNKALLYNFDLQVKACVKNTPNTFDIRAFLWQQGEGDYSTIRGGNRRCALDYYYNFKCLVAYVRGVAGNEKLPVICGTVSHLSGQYDPIVEEATLKVADEDPYMTCIDMSQATLLDSYHFDAESAIYFGYKAYDALIDFGVVSGTKINPTPPWES